MSFGVVSHLPGGALGFAIREKPFFGKAVVDGHLRYTSVSSLTSFDTESYGGCNRKWWWVKVAGKEEPETEAQRRGVEKHGELQHYLETGEDVLSPMIRAGKHLLPARGPDLLIEQMFGAHVERDNILAKRLVEQDPSRHTGHSDHDAMARRLEYVQAQIARYGDLRLRAGDVDLVGFIDLRHRRGVYVDVDGSVRREAPELGRVAECVDHKTSSSVVEYGKTGLQLLKEIQMIEYGLLVADNEPDIDTVRFSHITYQTRGAHYARKSTAVLAVDEIRRRAERVAGVAAQMRVAARATRVEDVEPHTPSCTSFGRKGCPHREYCQPDNRAIVYGQLGIVLPPPGETMSLFNLLSKKTADLIPTPSNGAPAAPSTEPILDAAAHEAEVARQRALLEAEDRGESSCAECATVLTADNTSRLPSGRVVHVGCSKAAPPAAPAAPNIGAILPPDAAKPTLLDAADPLTPDQIAQIGDDPAARAQATEHAHQHAERAAAVAKEKEEEKGPGAWCPGSYARVTVDVEMVVNRKKLKCPEVTCGKENALRPAKQDDGTYQATVPRHKPVAIEAAAATPTAPTAPKAPAPPAAPAAPSAPAAPAAPTYVAPGALPTQTAMPQVVPPAPAAPSAPPAPRAPAPPVSAAGPFVAASVSPAANSITLFVDVLVERGEPLTPLSDYYAPLLRSLEERFGVVDIRVAGKDTPLSFGSWRGALAALCRSAPPAPGRYHTRGADDFGAVVVEALAPVCAIYRGAR